MNSYRYEALGADNWTDFEALFAKHNGVRGGCWCSYYLSYAGEYAKLDRNARKCYHKQIVMNGNHTGILVYFKEIPVAWCQVASPDIIKRFDHSRIYKEMNVIQDNLPKWRISCVFVDKDHRNKGLAKTTLRFAMDHILACGGGVIEVFPFEFEDPRLSKFQHNGSVSFYESLGFQKVKKISKYEMLMTKNVIG